jgi:triacylglycerol lipase
MTKLNESEERKNRMPTAQLLAIRYSVILGLLALVLVSVSSCAKKRPPESGLPPPNFTQALQYAQRAALAYEQDATIKTRSGSGVRISISAPLSSGIKAYVEQDDAGLVQWIVVRGTSNVNNIRSDVDYNKVVVPRLEVPLHKGFAEAALQVYEFAKPLLKTDYETRVTGHSFGGAAGAIVLMLLKEDGFKLGQTITFGQPKVTNHDGVQKYRTLPLLRYVNDGDPVPSLPPFELFTALDEGPYQHFGPEVLLENGPNYRVSTEHQAERQSVLSFWNNLKNLSIQDVPDHSISTYLTRIQQKLPAPASR